MKEDEVILNYLKDSILILTESVEEIKKKSDQNATDKISEGHLIGLVEALHVLFKQAEAFDLDPAKLGFNFDPERFLYSD